LALERIVLSEPQFQRRIGIPWARRGCVGGGAIVFATNAEENVRAIELVGSNLVFIRDVLFFLERSPDPLRSACGLLHGVKADQSQGFRQTGPLRLRVARWH